MASRLVPCRWAFDEGGQLRDVPANTETDRMPDSRVNTHLCADMGGFIWFFWGDRTTDIPPIPIPPEMQDPSWTPVFAELDFDTHYMNVFENAIDVAHIHFLHNDTFGNDDTPQIQDMTKAEETPYSVSCNFILNNKAPNVLWEAVQVPEVQINVVALMPCCSYITFELGFGISFLTCVPYIPPISHCQISKPASHQSILTMSTPIRKC